MALWSETTFANVDRFSGLLLDSALSLQQHFSHLLPQLKCAKTRIESDVKYNNYHCIMLLREVHGL